MNDLIKRLRGPMQLTNPKADALEAADELEKNAAEIGRDDESWIDGQGTTAADLVADRLDCCGSENGVHLVGCGADDADRVHRQSLPEKVSDG